MDEKDFEAAAQKEQMQRDLSIAATRAKARRNPPPPDFDGFCACGAQIPPGRVAGGYYECVDCVTEEELRRKLRR